MKVVGVYNYNISAFHVDVLHAVHNDTRAVLYMQYLNVLMPIGRTKTFSLTI